MVTSSVTGDPQVCTFTAFPTSSPSGSPPLTVTKAHMSRQDREAGENELYQQLLTGQYEVHNTKENCERHSHISLLPRAFRAFLPRFPREKVASSCVSTITH